MLPLTTTLWPLENHVSMLGEVDTTHLETTEQRLHKVSDQQIVSYLKQGNLQELANRAPELHWAALRRLMLSLKLDWKTRR